MTEHNTVEVPVVLPGQDECSQCILRLQEHMQQLKGVTRVDLAERGSMMTVHFDPDLVTVRAVQELAREACGRLAKDYCHEVLVLGGLDCADCAKSIERAVTRHDKVLFASANFASSRLFVEYDCSDGVMKDVVHDVRALGYEVWTEEEYKQVRKSRSPKPFYLRSRRALLTLISFLFLLIGSALWLGTEEPHMAALPFLALSVACGYPIARNGLNALVRTRNVDMNVLMTVAVIGAMAVGEWVEAALVVVLFGFGETLESWAVERTRGSIQELMDLSPDEALIRHEGHEERVPVEDVGVGDVVVVKPGARIPLDGEVVKGHSAVDEAPITGESLPVGKEEGDLVFAGTINGRGTMEVSVSAPWDKSTLSRLIQLVEEAQGQKAPSERWVDSFARWYTPAVMIIAALTALGPPLVAGEAWSTWIYRGLALLILACPCALVISTPVSIVSAIGAASRQGVLIKGGAHLEAAGNLRALAFDKTGTLTEGLPRVTEVRSFNGMAPEAILGLAAAVERDSEHPLAEAITHAADTRGLETSEVHGFEALPGRGAQARLDGSIYVVGNRRLFAEMAVPLSSEVEAHLSEREERGETAILLGRLLESGAPGSNGAEALGAISVADEVRPVSREAVAALRAAGVEHIVMLTGDNERTAAAVAERVGLDEFRANLLPEHKVSAVKDLLRTHQHVGMVGDGINDAPALASATVGIAMGTAGTDTALQTADIALMADDLTKLPFTIRLSREARKIVRQNIGFALGLKVVATLLVFPGFLTLWMAVLADTGTSLLVILNGLRLLRHGRESSAASLTAVGEAGAARANGGRERGAMAGLRKASPVVAGGDGGATWSLEHDHEAGDMLTMARRPRRRPKQKPVEEGCACSISSHDHGDVAAAPGGG